jgi:hypothetical protein
LKPSGLATYTLRGAPPNSRVFGTSVTDRGGRRVSG